MDGEPVSEVKPTGNNADRLFGGLDGSMGILSAIFAVLVPVFGFIEIKDDIPAMVVMFLISALVQIAVGIGIWNHRKWAFLAALPMYGFCALTFAIYDLARLLGFALVVYAIVRLTGNMGPRPV